MFKNFRRLLLFMAALIIPALCGGFGPEKASAASSPPGIHPAYSAQYNDSYLGQSPPGATPTRFMPGLINGPLHSSVFFTPDGNEAYWANQSGEIFAVKFENGQWSQPQKVVLSSNLTNWRDPFISPSGDKFFFLSSGRLPNSSLPRKENVWYAERTGAGWGEPQPLSEEINSYDLHWQVSVAANGDIFFTSPPFEGDIMVSKCVDGKYVKAEKLSNSINTDLTETTPYIAPDESYIIFARLVDSQSSPLLFISFAEGTGGWTEAVRISQIWYGLCPVVSPDGKYLFFLSSPQSVSWMSTGFIQELKP